MTTSPSFTATGLFTGQEYKFKVSATNAVGTSNYSSESAGIIAAVVPDPPGTPFYLTSTKT